MKTNCISDVMKILIFAAVTIITCLIVALGIRAANTAKEIGNSAISNMAQYNNDIKENEMRMYDNEEVYGIDVVNCIKKYLGDYTELEEAPLYITVKTSLSENTYINSVYLDHIRNFSHNRYIKPTSIFIGQVVRNDNRVILGISFTQK